VPAEASRCPSCGAALRDGVDDEVPGVTQVDLKATSRLARLKPGRVAMWLGAERTTDDPSLSGRIEPPSEEVRKEMLRLELAALDAEIEVKTTLAEAQRSLPLEADGPPTADGNPPEVPASSDAATVASDAATVAPDAAAVAPDAAPVAPDATEDPPDSEDTPTSQPG
jgi:hypothetical protein